MRSSAFREIAALVWSQTSSFIKLRMAAALLLVLLSGMLSPLGPLALKLMIDDLTGHASVGALSIGLLATLYVASQWLSRSIGEIRGWVYSRAERRMFRTLSERLFRHVMHLPLSFHLERQTGAITQTLENGLQGYQRIVNQIVFTLLPVTVQLATIALVLFKFDQLVFLAIFFVAAVLYGIAYGSFARRVAGPAKAASTARVEANGALTDSIINYETVKLFAAEDIVQAKVSRAFINTEDQWGSFYRMSASNGLLVAAIYSTCLAACIGYALHLVRHGQMTVGDLILVNTYMLQVMQPVEMLGRAAQSITQGAAMLDRLLELFRQRTEEGLVPTARLSSRSAREMRREVHHPGGVTFEHVTFSYDSGRTTLKDVTFHLPPGRTLGIVGSSGSGKTSIVRLLFRLYEPQSGRILLDGAPATDLSLTALRSAIAVVPQDTVLFNDTVGSNIAFGKPGATQAEIEAAAQLAHLAGFIAALPQGYDTKVGERGLKLSGGEKQRVAIARAALKRPLIYVFDEATSSLDSRTEREILSNLRELARRATTIVIAHRLSTVVHADEIVVLSEGAIVERGTHAALLQLGGRYAALWRAQLSERPPLVVVKPH